MSGLEVNGNGLAAITAGTKAPGKVTMRDAPGNQDIGRIITKVTDGTKAIGSKARTKKE
jgi:hypothetical protein